METRRPSNSTKALTLAALALWAIGAATTVTLSQLPAGGRYIVSEKAVRWHSQFDPVAEVTIRDSVTGETRRLDVRLDPKEVPQGAQGNEIEVTVVADRAVVVMPREAYCKEVTVLGLPSGKIVDNFMGCGVSPSPNKTRAVYRYDGGWSIMDEVVVAYDFTRSPLENLSMGYSGIRFAPKGIILFPPENKARGAYETKSDPLKLVASPFAWCRNDRFAFLSATAAMGDDVRLIDLRLIEMSLPADARQARVIAEHPVDASVFRGPATLEWPLERPLPLLHAKDLRYSDDCRSLTIVSLAQGPFAEKAVALPTGEAARDRLP